MHATWSMTEARTAPPRRGCAARRVWRRSRKVSSSLRNRARRCHPPATVLPGAGSATGSTGRSASSWVVMAGGCAGPAPARAHPGPPGSPGSAYTSCRRRAQPDDAELVQVAGQRGLRHRQPNWRNSAASWSWSGPAPGEDVGDPRLPRGLGHGVVMGVQEPGEEGLWACRRFCLIPDGAGRPSSTSAVISSPRWAGSSAALSGPLRRGLAGCRDWNGARPPCGRPRRIAPWKPTRRWRARRRPCCDRRVAQDGGRARDAPAIRWAAARIAWSGR